MSLDTFLSNRKLKCMRFGWLPPGTLERIRLNQNGGRYIKGKVRARSETEQIGVWKVSLKRPFCLCTLGYLLLYIVTVVVNLELCKRLEGPAATHQSEITNSLMTCARRKLFWLLEDTLKQSSFSSLAEYAFNSYLHSRNRWHDLVEICLL